ncbi:MAG: hypothetical protein IJ533_05335 [Prevotella sp.]|nr:hypothetical protein [Prevotella sp.]
MKRIALITIMALSALAGAADTVAQEAGELYAVLLSGGRNRLTNHERYWNDCAFLYRTLRHTYHVPQRNMTVLMSDGGDPAPDMLRYDGRGLASSPVDLDGDGLPDDVLAATSRNVSSTLIGLSNRLTAADRLLLFVIDHGGRADSPFIWLWNEEQLSDYALWSLLSLLRVQSLCVVMGQCYSGGFLSRLSGNGRVVMTACRADEQSWTCPDRPYDEFVYHWTCAINGADADGQPVHADGDGDGRVTMAEAFSYAQRHDRCQETPQYCSWPEQLGDEWALGQLHGVGMEVVSRGEAERRSARSLQGYGWRGGQGGVVVAAGRKFINQK